MSTSRNAGFADRVASTAGHLSPQGRAVVDYLIDQPDKAVTASAADIAAATATSDATVIRTARSLGYTGLRDLKRDLLATITDRSDPATVLDHRVRRITSQLGPVLELVIRDTAALLDELPHVLDQSDWTHAIDLLDQAQRLWLYGSGPAGHVSQYHALELSRLGKKARAVTDTGFRLADPLMELGSDDAVIIYAPLRFFNEIDVIITHASHVGASTIVITETLGPAIQDRVDAVLTTPPSTTSAASEYLAGHVIAHTLTLELAARDRVSSVAARNLLNRLRTAIAGPEMDRPVNPS